jgi:hypothetical protein
MFCNRNIDGDDWYAGVEVNMFDPNATPLCDKFNEETDSPLELAKAQERRASRAEHELLKTRLQLNKAILLLQGIYYSYGRYNDFSKRLDEIEKVIE